MGALDEWVDDLFEDDNDSAGSSDDSRDRPARVLTLYCGQTTSRELIERDNSVVWNERVLIPSQEEEISSTISPLDTFSKGPTVSGMDTLMPSDISLMPLDGPLSVLDVCRRSEAFPPFTISSAVDSSLPHLRETETQDPMMQMVHTN